MIFEHDLKAQRLHDCLVQHLDDFDRRAAPQQTRSRTDPYRTGRLETSRTDARPWRLRAPKNFKLASKCLGRDPTECFAC